MTQARDLACGKLVNFNLLKKSSVNSTTAPRAPLSEPRSKTTLGSALDGQMRPVSALLISTPACGWR